MRKKKRRLKKKFALFLAAFLILIGFCFWGVKYFSSSRDWSEVQRDQGQGEKKEDNAVVNKLDPAPKNSLEYLALADGEYLTDKGYTLVIQDGVASIDGQVIANKTYSLPRNYQPPDPYQAVRGERCNDCIDKTAMKQFQLMQSDAQALGLNIYIASGYRSYQYQVNLYDRYVSTSGKAGADTYSSRPGYSEHQTGLCFDLNSIEDSFANTNEGRWVNENAYRYGFVIRFPKGQEKYTGYQYESWHLRYVGEALAKQLYHDGEYLSLEEYYGITSSYE